jgi:integrase
MWQGLWHVYVRQPDGTEKRLPRTKVLGPATMSKAEAQRQLDKLIAASGVPPQSASSFTRYSKFEDVWKRYCELKQGTWGMAARRAIVSIFEGESKKKKQASVLSVFGHRPVCEITRDPLQYFLNGLATAGASYSVVKKARTYLAAAFQYAADERLIDTNPARKLDLPTRLLQKRTCRRFYTLDEIRNLLAIAPLREHVVLRIFFVCGLRPSELFILRDDDIEPDRIRIDQALKEAEKGQNRIGQEGDTKTPDSAGYVALSRSLQEEIENWRMVRGERKQHHRSVTRAESNLLFPSETGTPFRIGNYLKRTLKPLAGKAGIPDLTYQGLRRTCATFFQRHGRPRDVQAHLRHTSLATTGIYMQEIPEQVQRAVEDLDTELFCERTGNLQ